jgi:uncharacterized protein (TIGR02611 family)
MGDRPTGPIKIIRATIRANRIANAFWRTAIFFIGFFLVGVGLVLLVLPGPGWLLIFLGFVTLATEFAWASNLLAPLRVRLEKAKIAGRKPSLWFYVTFTIFGILTFVASLWVWTRFPR